MMKPKTYIYILVKLQKKPQAAELHRTTRSDQPFSKVGIAKKKI